MTPPHGNAKGNNPQPFQTTKTSVKEAMKCAPKDKPRKQLFNELLAEAGVPLNVAGFGDHPRKRNQISDFRRNQQKEEIVEIADLCKEQQRQQRIAFVQDVTVAPETPVFLANERQLNDVKRFCTHPHCFLSLV